LLKWGCAYRERHAALYLYGLGALTWWIRPNRNISVRIHSISLYCFSLIYHSIGALCHPLEWTDNALGSIPGCSDIKLVDFPEAGYFAANKQGEVWIRGENVMKGYYDDPKQTSEAVTSDGWFKTGDIGEWDKNGHLKLIDRKKNLVKTRNGEYIAIEKVNRPIHSSLLNPDIGSYTNNLSQIHSLSLFTALLLL
jgi:hypothetical protein